MAFRKGLRESEVELLAKLAEESGELTQALMKLLRKGKRNGEYDNLGRVIKESTDLLLIVSLLSKVFPEKFAELSDYPLEKLVKLEADLEFGENVFLVQELREELSDEPAKS